MPQFQSYPISTSLELGDTILFFQDSTNTVKQIAFSDLIASIQTQTNNAQSVTYLNADTVLTPSMGMVVVNSGANVSLTLPTAATTSGVTFPILNKGAGHVTVQPSGSDTIAGENSITLTQYQSARLQSDGSSLYSQ